MYYICTNIIRSLLYLQASGGFSVFLSLKPQAIIQVILLDILWFSFVQIKSSTINCMYLNCIIWPFWNIHTFTKSPNPILLCVLLLIQRDFVALRLYFYFTLYFLPFCFPSFHSRNFYQSLLTYLSDQLTCDLFREALPKTQNGTI